MRPTRRLQAAVALACAGVVLTGCSGKKSPDAASSTTSAASSAESSAEPSDSSSSDSDFDLTLVPATPEPSGGSSTGDSGASSSSSPASTPTAKPSPSKTPSKTPSPTSTPVVAAGRVFAFIKKIDTGTRVLTYDQAQFLTGDAAVKAAAEDKQTLDTDFYIRNVNKRLRTAPVAPDAGIFGTQPLTDQVELTPVTLEGVAGFIDGDIGSQVGFWITVDGKGRITKVEEQYVP